MAAEGVEPTFQEARRHLGFETQRQWSDRAIHRTTPLLLGLFSLVTLWAADQAARAGNLAVLGAAWYRKPDPTFADCLAVVRRVLWAEEAVIPSRIMIDPCLSSEFGGTSAFGGPRMGQCLGELV